MDGNLLTNGVSVAIIKGFAIISHKLPKEREDLYENPVLPAPKGGGKRA
jgi:hypothetical protein